MKVYCTGCSWTQHWPYWLTLDRRWDYFDGCGLHVIGESVRNSDWADRVVVQLPTPVRSYRTGTDWHCRTRDLFVLFWSTIPVYGTARANVILLDTYRDELLRINRLRQGIVFFEFNTAGYPFRHCHDFGADCSDEMLFWASDHGLEWLRLDLSGKPGMTLKEVPESMLVETDAPEGWSVVNPPGLRVIDGHPSEAAQTLAAETVEAYLCGG